MVWPFSSSSGALPPKTQAARDRKQAEQAQAIDDILHLIDGNVALSEDLPFLSCSIREIVTRLEQRTPQWSAQRVMEAFIRSAIRSHQSLNCLTEIFFTAAWQQAKALDVEFARTGKLAGPLHGVPVSLKDQFSIEGKDNSLGFSKYVDEPATEDSQLATLLKQAGAIPFCKTNVPQTMLAFECGNPVFGRTLNPYSDEHTCGGSSGGEAALIASDGSPVGIGSDIGGSLRIPAHFSGCYGLKPGWGRFPTGGSRAVTKGFEGIRVSAGPLGRSVDDLSLMTQTIIQGSEKAGYHATERMIPIPWRDVELPKKLRFGYYKTDDLVKHSPVCQRAVQESVDALRKAGHECVEFKPPSTAEAMRLFVSLSSADGYAQLLSHLESDPAEPSLFLINLQRQLGPYLLSALTALSRMADPISAHIVSEAGLKPVGAYHKSIGARDDYADAYRKMIWGDMALDGVICPTQAGPAIPHGSGWNLAFLAAATLLYNVVDCAAGVVPVTRVDPVKDALTEDWVQHGGANGSPTLEGVLYGKKELGTGIYDVQAMAGLPVGVQVVGPMWQEEKVLKMMKVLDDALGPRNFRPGRYASQK